jgi:hypothetical protein
MQMLVKLKYVGTGGDDVETGLTTNNVYVALVITTVGKSGNAPSAIILDDSGLPYTTHSIAQPLYWEVVSVTAPGEVQIYP